MRTAILGGWSLALIVVLVLCSKMARRGEAVDKQRQAKREIDEALRRAEHERAEMAAKPVAVPRIVTNRDGLLREMVPPTSDADFVGVLIVELANSGHRILQREREGRAA